MPQPESPSPAATYLALLVICSAGSWLITLVVSVFIGSMRWVTGMGWPGMWWMWSAPIWAGTIATWTVIAYGTRKSWLADLP